MDSAGRGDGSEFQSLGEYRQNFNMVEPFSDFKYETAKSLSCFANILEKDATGVTVVTMLGAESPVPELQHLQNERQKRNRMLINFSNSSDEMRLQVVLPHQTVLIETLSRRCALCGIKRQVGWCG